jgi:hypothetical protein
VKHYAGVGFVLYSSKEHAEKGNNVHASTTIKRSREKPGEA